MDFLSNYRLEVKVAAGDTLSGIAKRFGLTVSFIKENNNLTTYTI